MTASQVGGGGRSIAYMYMGDMDMCGCEGSSSSLIWDRVYKPESLGLE